MGTIFKLDLGIITWPKNENRVSYLERCIRRFRTYLVDHANIRFMCSAETEGTPSQLRERIIDICRAHSVDLFWRPGVPCIGGNINNLFRNMETPFLFLAEDDRLLTRTLDFDPGMEILEENQTIPLINYSTQTGRKSLCLQGEVGYGDFYYVSNISPWIAVNMQILFHERFLKKYGGYSEDVDDPDGAEREMNVRLKSKHACALYSATPYFVHCGDVSAIPRPQKEVANSGSLN